MGDHLGTVSGWSAERCTVVLLTSERTVELEIEEFISFFAMGQNVFVLFARKLFNNLPHFYGILMNVPQEEGHCCIKYQPGKNFG